jgi:hypothetical protein
MGLYDNIPRILPEWHRLQHGYFGELGVAIDLVVVLSRGRRFADGGPATVRLISVQAKRPLKDVRSRRVVSLLGTVAVKAPRFKPCSCAVTCRRTLSPVSEIMPDRCTPEYERVLAKMGALLPYRRARTVLSEFLPLGRPQTEETIRRRTLCVGARLERKAVAAPACAPAEPATSITLSIDGGHIRATPQYQGRTFELLLAVILTGP